MPKDNWLRVRIDTRLKDELEALAKREGRTLSNLVVKILDDYTVSHLIAAGEAAGRTVIESEVRPARERSRKRRAGEPTADKSQPSGAARRAPSGRHAALKQAQG